MKTIYITIIAIFLTAGINAQCTLDFKELKVAPYEDNIKTPPTINPTGGPLTGPRTIIWLHGMEGSETSWQAAGEYSTTGVGDPSFNGWKINSVYPAYNENDETTVSSANWVKSQIENIDNSNGKNFLIAHSMGSIVSRKIEADYNNEQRPYSGLITFGGLHKGVKAVNSFQEGKMEDFLDEACTKMSNGIYREVSTHPALDIPGVQLILQNVMLELYPQFFSLEGNTVQEKICNALVSFGYNYLLESFASGALDEIEFNSEIIQEINNFDSDIAHRVAFYGKETDNDDLFWRLMGEVKTMIAGGDVGALPLWGAGASDEAIFEIRNKTYNFFYGRYVKYQDEVDNRWNGECTWRDLNPTQRTCGEQEWIRDGYRDSKNFLNQANNKWKVLIGARNYVPKSGMVTYCKICEEWEDETVQEDCKIWLFDDTVIDNCSSYNGTLVEKYEEWSEWEDQPSDGLVLKSSSVGYENAYEYIEMPGSGHFQMRNDQNTKDAMISIFDGGIANYFKEDKNN